MKRSPMPPRKSYMRKRSKGHAKLQRERFGKQAALCRALPCIACGADTGCDPHHHPPVSLGGKDRDTVPLCRTHHTTGGAPHAVHDTPLPEWEAFHGVNIEDELAKVRELVRGSA